MLFLFIIYYYFYCIVILTRDVYDVMESLPQYASFWNCHYLFPLPMVSSLMLLSVSQLLMVQQFLTPVRNALACTRLFISCASWYFFFFFLRSSSSFASFVSLQFVHYGIFFFPHIFTISRMLRKWQEYG